MQKSTENKLKWILLFVVIVGFAAGIIYFDRILTEITPDIPDSTTIPKSTPENPPAVAEKSRRRVEPPAKTNPCVGVSTNMVSEITKGLTVTGGGHLRNARAIKSEHRENVYFISAEIDGPGMWGDGEIGTWIVNTLEPIEYEYGTSMALNSYSGNGLPHSNLGGIIMATPGLAEEFSDWRQGYQVNWRRSLLHTDTEIQSSVACVREAQRQ